AFGVLGTVERLKQVLAIWLRNADTSVLDHQGGLPVSTFQVEQDAATLWRVFDSVREQVDNNVPQQVSIHDRVCAITLAGENQAVRCSGRGLYLLDKLTTEIRQIEPFGLKFHAPGLGFTKSQHV